MKAAVVFGGAAGALVLRAAVAIACGGAGDGEGGSSSSGSSGGSSDSGGAFAPGPAAEPACVDASDVNGYRTCSKFGADWAIPARLPAISVELASWGAQVALSDIDVGGAVSHTWGDDYNYRVVTEDLAAPTAPAAGLKLRVLGHRRSVYAGVEGGVAAVMLAPSQKAMPTTDGMTTLTTEVDALTTLGAVLGIDHDVGRLSLGAELMLGAQALVMSTKSVRGACETESQHWVGRGLVEGRVRADAWLTPWLTVGGYVGKDVVSGGTGGGLSIGGHLRAFDGGR
ncbi:MAG: hypothetical protein KBG48_05800 [Kofleriaceae bacterium]|jgi:hypothetical protein|nr:hypothetical protein [Kofleriaceae bacterium]MBP9166878.1 hypothetical protein [Kofleriaceae bacterium]MBP9860009.1 hypothetical protein [Kofleriaceae bacterium]